MPLKIRSTGLGGGAGYAYGFYCQLRLTLRHDVFPHRTMSLAPPLWSGVGAQRVHAPPDSALSVHRDRFCARLILPLLPTNGRRRVLLIHRGAHPISGHVQ
jgi:hypothetical protein